ncbi:MotA/TolQ/ExbB proton channel family protein [Parahaliea sp. F7430]|uniref:MotA/TolQ/ExbB proton channel family protein n=1 Tax=Sediminihaliea albiluteola TaxID=2758564 RepID=A0A7W2TX19_9GAMM|nr:MotA/TolQ/ExbB proton channel family protein [Sediminihaliea albiluteola]MBA6413515.1 MotA/TolQ/ExbB proton channel family protein [Sediminihaliea albiluteola]
MYWFDSAYEAVSRFMDMGGNVLWLIAILLFFMWALIFERVWYFKTGWRSDAAKAISTWEGRSERKSWAAHQIREKLISQSRMQINQYLPIIKTMVALCPLLGLLGTVTGMIEVFNIMAVTGGGDAKSMAGGVSRATIPTMAGMVAALSGVFANTYVTRVAQRESAYLEDNLTTDH